MNTLKAFQDAVIVRNVTARFKAAAIGYSDEELAILAMILSLKPGYRAKELEEAKLGPYSKENPHIKSLIEKGLLKTNSSGAISIVKTKADNVLKEEYTPEKYRYHIPNPSFHFKRREASSVVNSLPPNQHYIEKCGTCGTIISQCKCMGNKMVVLGTCENCAGKCEGGCSGECDGKCSGACAGK